MHADFGVRHWASSVRRLLHQIRRDRHRRVANPLTLPSRLILLIADLLHPVDYRTVQRFLNGDMRHRRRRGRAMPMLLTGRKPDHIAWPDFLDRAALTLRPAESGRDDQRLTEWMRMPGGARTRLERDARATNTGWFGCFEQRINAN